jgi:DNA polymerase I-like protein with 3'-5' exonuclease and polymerase domains
MAVLAIAMVAGLAGSRSAVGEEKDDAEGRLQSFTVQLKEHEVADTRHAATSEIGKAEALRDKARTLTEKRSDREVLDRTLDELEATLALVGAKIVHAGAKAKLDEQKAKMGEIKAKLAKTKTSADELEKKQADMSSKLGGGK